MQMKLSARLVAVVRTAAETAASDHPLDPDVVRGMLSRLGESEVVAWAKPGDAPVELTMEPDEFEALEACFDVGAELAPGISDEDWAEITAAMKAARGEAAPATWLPA